MTGKKADCQLSAVCAAVYIILIWNLIPVVYGIIDDRSMMEILSGQYLGVPDPHAIFLGFWYSLALAGLYQGVPEIDWYALSYLFWQGVCIWMILYRILRKEQEEPQRTLSVCVCLLAFTVFALPSLTQLTFTTTATVLGSTLLFWYMTTEQISVVDVGVLAVLGFLTCQIRYSIFLMILPVCAVLWLFRIAKKDQRNRWNLLMPVVVAGIFFIDITGDWAGYGSPEWRDYQEYNKYRSAVYDYADYTFPIYEGAESFYRCVGIEKKSRARTLINYNYTADDQIQPEFFREYIKEYQKAFPPQESRWERIRRSIKEYGTGIIKGRFHLQHKIALILYALLCIWHVRRRSWYGCMKAADAAGIQMLLWIYLIYEGRIPERVIYSMNLMFMTVAFFLWLEVLREQKRCLRLAGKQILCLILCVLSVVQITRIRQQNMETYHRNKSVEELKEYCMEHSENFYFNDVTSLAFTTSNVQLWREEPYWMNYMSLGDWMSFSPVWKEKLEQHQIEHVKEALYEQEHIYLICSFDKGLEYLALLYENVVCTELDKVAGFGIYRLQSL